MNLKKAIKLRKAKYIKRTGSSGKYKYIYKEKVPRGKVKVTAPGDPVTVTYKKGIYIGKEKGKAPEFKGDWGDDKALHKYAKDNAGKSVTIKGKSFKIGQEIYVAGDPSVGIPSADATLLAQSSLSGVIVYYSDVKEIDEVGVGEIA